MRLKAKLFLFIFTGNHTETWQIIFSAIKISIHTCAIRDNIMQKWVRINWSYWWEPCFSILLNQSSVEKLQKNTVGTLFWWILSLFRLIFQSVSSKLAEEFEGTI